MLPKKKEMEVLELSDLTESASAAAELAGMDPRAVRRAVAARPEALDLRARAPVGGPGVGGPPPRGAA
jgi:hypothetical protein